MEPNFILTTVTCGHCGRATEKMLPRRLETRAKNAPHGHFCDRSCARKARYRRGKAGRGGTA